GLGFAAKCDDGGADRALCQNEGCRARRDRAPAAAAVAKLERHQVGALRCPDHLAPLPVSSAMSLLNSAGKLSNALSPKKVRCRIDHFALYRYTRGAFPLGEKTMIATNLLRVSVLIILVGMIMGMAMGAMQDFRLMPVHAHLNLLGFVG